MTNRPSAVIMVSNTLLEWGITSRRNIQKSDTAVA
jgi:hypothetical protein